MYLYANEPVGADSTIFDVLTVRAEKSRKSFSLTEGFMPVILGFGAVIAVGIIYKASTKGKRRKRRK